VTLTKENNQLHLDLIHNVEAREQEKWETQKVIRKHENEINAMRFVNGQYLGMAQESEGKLDSECKKIENLLKSCEVSNNVLLCIDGDCNFSV